MRRELSPPSYNSNIIDQVVPSAPSMSDVSVQDVSMPVASMPSAPSMQDVSMPVASTSNASDAVEIVMLTREELNELIERASVMRTHNVAMKLRGCIYSDNCGEASKWCFILMFALCNIIIMLLSLSYGAALSKNPLFESKRYLNELQVGLLFVPALMFDIFVTLIFSVVQMCKPSQDYIIRYHSMKLAIVSAASCMVFIYQVIRMSMDTTLHNNITNYRIIFYIPLVWICCAIFIACVVGGQ